MIRNQINSKILCVTLSMFLGYPALAMDKESNDYSRQLSIYDGWELVDDYNVSDKPVENDMEDFELKARALANTAVYVFGGAAMTVCNIGINIIGNTIQRNADQIERGVRAGSQLIGFLYGQGVALDAAYENEKDLLRSK